MTMADCSGRHRGIPIPRLDRIPRESVHVLLRVSASARLIRFATSESNRIFTEQEKTHHTERLTIPQLALADIVPDRSEILVIECHGFDRCRTLLTQPESFAQPLSRFINPACLCAITRQVVRQFKGVGKLLPHRLQEVVRLHRASQPVQGMGTIEPAPFVIWCRSNDAQRDR